MSKEQEIQYLLKNPSQLAKYSFKFFCKKILKLDYEEHHDAWYKTLKESDRLLIQCSRDHGKTYFWSYAYPLWMAYNGRIPKIELNIISYSEPQSTRLISHIKDEIETNSYLVGLRPKPGATWSKTELQCGNGAFVCAGSFGTASRGGHYHIIIVDDPLKDFGGLPRDEQRQYFFGVVSPMVRPGGQLIVVGTPIAFGDLLEHLEENKVYLTKKFPAIKADGTALWAGRYSLEALNAKRKEIGSLMFAREFMLKRVSSDTARFKRDWLKYYERLPEGLDYFTTVDPAVSKEGDPSVILTIGVNRKNRWYLADYDRGWYNPSELINKIFLAKYHWRSKKVGVELISFQLILKHFIKEEMRKRNKYFPIEELNVGTNTKKEGRILCLQPKFEAGDVYIKRSMEDFLDEYLTFPNGRTDDILDALEMQLAIAKPPVSQAEQQEVEYIPSNPITGY